MILKEIGEIILCFNIMVFIDGNVAVTDTESTRHPTTHFRGSPGPTRDMWVTSMRRMMHANLCDSLDCQSYVYFCITSN